MRCSDPAAGAAIAGGAGCDAVNGRWHFVLLRKPRRVDWRPEAGAVKPNLFRFVPPLHGSCNRRGGKVRSGRRSVAFIAAQQRALTGSSRLYHARCLKRGRWTKEENWSPSLLAYARKHVRVGVAGRKCPHGWGAENAGLIGRLQRGKGGASFA